ncbi:HNH endonuclease [Priestia flexa]|uniref:HNH endonuclease n=1 Tax=Priestia flexa TaxID=86664 RepID=UPI000684C8AF|nr:HNH endonuclease [Priestia flexa]
MRICTIDSCNNKHEAKGFCKKHYRSYLEYGDALYVENKRSNNTELETGKPYKKNRKSRIDYGENHKMIDDIEHKKCSVCNEWKPMNNDYFYKNKSNSVDGFHPYCKKCVVNKSKEWRKIPENREKALISQRKDNAKQHRKEQKRLYGQKRRESGEYKQWQRDNKDKITQYRLIRTNKKHDISLKEWEACKRYFNDSCAYCGLEEIRHKNMFNQQLHREHVEHEGANDISNCVPSCKTCNSEKHVYNLEDWYTEDNEKYSKERSERIIKWLEGDYKISVET